MVAVGKMKKRIRKKRRVGEFREDCFQVEFEFIAELSPSERDAVLDRFIAMIEEAGLQFGGGVDTRCTGIVEFCGRGSATDQHREFVLGWIRNQPETFDEAVGPLVDAWHTQ